MRDIDILAVVAAKDEKKLDELILQYKFYILKCASKTSKRYITINDDEWSIALIAFTEAVKSYSLDKGSFLSFSDLVIKRRIIDYYKSNQKYNNEISVNPEIFDGELDEDENTSVMLSVLDKISYRQDDNLKYEIEAINSVFREYGFSFFDLTDCSPKAEKTKNSCALIVAFIFKNPLLINELRISKQLPIKTIEPNVKVPRKILERHRKYIIAAVEILSGEYPYLAEYMWYIRKELDK